MARPLAVVTGASSGLGESFARVLAQHGHDVVLVARRVDRLDALARQLSALHGVETHCLPLDLCEPSSARRLAEHLDGHGLRPEVLVNNAGRGIDGRFLDTTWDDQAALLQLILLTPTELVHRLLPGMLTAGRGRVVTMASLGGLLHSTPLETLYGPVKRFGIALSRSLATEYRGSGVTFTAVCPGLTRTEMMDHGRPAVAKRRVPSWLIAEPDRVARTAWAATVRGELVVVPGVSNKLTALALKLMPTDAGDRVVTAMFDRITTDGSGHAGITGE